MGRRRESLSLWRQAVSLGWRAVSATCGDIWSAVSGSAAYPSTDPRRKLLEGFRAPVGTGNQHLARSLSQLIAQGRHLDRSAPVVRGAIEGRKAELVGTGIDVEPTTGDPKLNAELKAAWRECAMTIGVNGESLYELQRLASGELDVAGNGLWRFLVLPERVAAGQLPLAILPLEAEWLSEQPVATVPSGIEFVRGVLINALGQPVACDLVNPDQPLGAARGERVPIDQLNLFFERRRARLALGEPRMAPLIERTFQDDEIVLSELKTARNASGLSVLVYSNELAQVVNGTDDKGEVLPPTRIDTGSIGYLGTADRAEILKMDRPSGAVTDFRKNVKNDLAAGAGISRVWLDRDGSAYNFANSKFDQIRTQMMVKPAHDWFGRAVASRPYLMALPWLMLRLGRPMPTDPVQLRRLQQHTLIPDVPPELDEQAANKAFESGYAQGITSKADFLGARGKDPLEVARQIDLERRADAQAAAQRIADLQKTCDQLNKANPGLSLTWQQLATFTGIVAAPLQTSQTTAPTSSDPTQPAP
jgi:capsid protein